MTRFARTCAVLLSVGWLTLALAQSTPVVVTNPKDASKAAGTAKLSDGGYGLEVHLENAVVQGQDGTGTARTLATTQQGAVYVVPLFTVPVNPFLQRCNAVRRSNCQP